ncbi:MAG: hypothetical protein ACHQDF_00510 [Chitinophagales bacterium]
MKQIGELSSLGSFTIGLLTMVKFREAQGYELTEVLILRGLSAGWHER